MLDQDLAKRARKFHGLDGLKEELDEDALFRGVLLAKHKDNLGSFEQTEQASDSNAEESVQPNEPRSSIPLQPFHNGDGDGSGSSAAVAERSTGRHPFPQRKKRLTELEKKALRLERQGSLQSLTKEVIVIIATCAIGAIAQGWSQESIVGANIIWPARLDISHIAANKTLLWNYYDPHATSTHPDKGLEQFSAVNAITYFAAAIFGAGLSDPFSYVFGRRSALFFAGICTLGGPIGAAYSETWIQLFFCRFIQGVGVGAKSSVVPVLESEILLPKLRGRLLVSWQTSVAVGIWLGTIANLIFRDNWRHQIGIAFLPAVPLLCLCFVIPEYVMVLLLPEPQLILL